MNWRMCLITAEGAGEAQYLTTPSAF